METDSIQKFLKSEDPLSNEAFEFFLNYKEEDSLIDYKETFHPNDEKEWLEITKDIMAFANTYGGFLIFGVRNGSFEVTGLDDDLVKLLTDTNKILQKVNRHLDPSINLLRGKVFVRDNKRVVGIFIPVSVGATHVISKDGSFKHLSGAEKIILQKGTLYVRRSAGNHLADARDIDDIINRRMEQFREFLLDKITRVIEAPPESEVFILSKDPNAEPNKKFIIQDASGAIPVKGMSFTVTPETFEQKIAAWIAMSSQDNNAKPSYHVLWEWYENRHDLQLSEKQRVQVAKFCVLSEVPVFFWLQKCDANLIKEMLLGAITNRVAGVQIAPILKVVPFLGKGFYSSVINNLGSYSNRLSQGQRRYPPGGPRSLFDTTAIEIRANKNSKKILRMELENELTEIAAKLHNSEKQKIKDSPRLVWDAHNYDCYLYAQDDKYIKAISNS